MDRSRFEKKHSSGILYRKKTCTDQYISIYYTIWSIFDFVFRKVWVYTYTNVLNNHCNNINAISMDEVVLNLSYQKKVTSSPF